MNGAELGAKYLDVSGKMLQTVTSPALAVNASPPQDSMSRPRCLRYHSRIAAGSRALKKMPPMPVTRAMESSLISELVRVLPTKDERQGRTKVPLPSLHRAVEFEDNVLRRRGIETDGAQIQL